MGGGSIRESTLNVNFATISYSAVLNKHAEEWMAAKKNMIGLGIQGHT